MLIPQLVSLFIYLFTEGIFLLVSIDHPLHFTCTLLPIYNCMGTYLIFACLLMSRIDSKFKSQKIALVIYLLSCVVEKFNLLL
jgi:hypothetical protein